MNDALKKITEKALLASRLLISKPMILEQVLAGLLEDLYWAEVISFDSRGNAYNSHSGDYLDDSVESVED